MIATDTPEKLKLDMPRKKTNVDKQKTKNIRRQVVKDDKETDCDESQLQLQDSSEIENFMCSSPEPENICCFSGIESNPLINDHILVEYQPEKERNKVYYIGKVSSCKPTQVEVLFLRKLLKLSLNL